MIKILMSGPLSVSGGVSTHTKNLSKALKELGIDVILHNQSNKNSNTDTDGTVPRKIYQRTIGLLMTIASLRKRYDIIHIQASGGIAGFIPALMGSIAAKFLRKPIIITFHHSKTEQFVRKYRGLFKFTLDKCSSMILVSGSQKNCVLQQFPEYANKIIVIPNGYNPSIFYPMDKFKCQSELMLPVGKKIVFNISNLIESKGHYILIDAMSEVIKNQNNVICFIAGQGNCRTKLNDQINTLGLGNYVKMIGWISDEMIPIWMNACDVFVFPSLAESFGIVQIEAMACGVPVVATYNGGSENVIISDDYGYLVESRNMHQLSEKIVLALNRTWNKKTIVDYAREFSWQSVALETLNLYNKILNG